MAGYRQRLCRGPETSSAKPTAPSMTANVDVVFAESRAVRLSAKTFLFFLKKKSLPRGCLEGSRQSPPLPRTCQTGSRQRRALPRAVQTGSRQRLFIFFKKNLCREPLWTALGKGGNFFVFYFFPDFYMHSHICIYISQSTCLYHTPHIYHMKHIEVHRYHKST